MMTKGQVKAAKAARASKVSLTDGRSSVNAATWNRTNMVQKQAEAARGRSTNVAGRNERGQITNPNVAYMGRSANGRLAIIDERGRANTRDAKTWTMSDKDRGRQSGRSQVANRSQRRYDVVSGFNDISPNAARYMLEAGQITQAEYDRMFGQGGNAGGGGKGGSLGLSAG